MQCYEVSRRSSSKLGQDSIGVAVRDHTRHVQGLVEDEGLVVVSECD